MVTLCNDSGGREGGRDVMILGGVRHKMPELV